MKIEDINMFNLNEDELKEIVNNIAMKYTFQYNTKVTQNLIKEDIQEAINQYTIQQRRDNKINQILGNETNIPDKRININIDFDKI